MTSNYYWLKLHYDILDDWKVGTLPDSLKWLFIQCLCVAGETNEDGLLPDINHFAYRIRREVKALNADMARLASNELVELVVDEDGRERWLVSNFNKRQERIPAKERMRSYRERKRQDEMESNATDTQPLRDSYDTVTGRNTDKIRIDIDKSREDKSIYTRTYDNHAENQPPPEVNQALTALRNISKTSKTRFDVSNPPDAIERFAYELVGAEQVDAIGGFSEWWQGNGYYAGKPAVKSVIDEWANYVDGVMVGAEEESELVRIAREVANGVD